MIYTSNYANSKKYISSSLISVSISGDRGKMENYTGKCYPALAPKLGFWKIWHENIGKISEEENTEYYVREYINQVLNNLNPATVFCHLDNSILLCYEPSLVFCHRHIVALWLEKNLSIKVPEIIIDENNKITETSRNDKICDIILKQL